MTHVFPFFQFFHASLDLNNEGQLNPQSKLEKRKIEVSILFDQIEDSACKN